MSIATPSPARTKHIASPQKTSKATEDFTKIKGSTEFAATALDPPKAAKVPTAVANYQTRWEREKAKARAEGTSIEPKDPKMIGPWIIGEMLGRGASGRVRLARHYATGKMAAVKILTLHPHLSSRSSALANAGDKAEKMMLTAEREIAVMKLLDHPNIMQMYDVWSSPKELYLVLEYVQGGELFDYLCSRGSRLPLLEAVSIIKQVLAGVDYCHRFNICHRDLKPENILLTTDSDPSSSDSQLKRVKIADFGMSTLDSLNGLLRTSCGSPHYASPEIVRGQTYSGASSDIWSCGVILYALLTSRLPFDDPNVNNVLKKVRDGKFSVPEWVAPPAKDLLTRMLEVDIGKRITMPDILSHPLLQMDTPGIILPPVPKIDEIALPVAREDVDPDLLRNLCIIWREKDKISMVTRLCSTETNFEKAFYFLLCRYRDRSFEEYNMEPTSFASNTDGLSSPLPTPPYERLEFNQVDSPIKRHYPGRSRAQSLSRKRTPSARHDGSPKSSKVRRNSVRRGSVSSDKRSPRKSRVLAESNNAPSPRGSIKSRNDEAKDGSLRELKSRPSKVADSAVGLLGAKRTPAPSNDISRASVISPRKVSDFSPSKRLVNTHSHRRASSASASTGVPKSHSGGHSFLPNPVNRSEENRNNGRIRPKGLGALPEDVASKSILAGSSAIPTQESPNVPQGLVQRRASVLSAKLALMDPSKPGILVGSRTPGNTSLHTVQSRPGTPRKNAHTPTTPRKNPSGTRTPSRSFSKVLGSPTVYGPVSPRGPTSTILPPLSLDEPDILPQVAESTEEVYKASDMTMLSPATPTDHTPRDKDVTQSGPTGLGVFVASSTARSTNAPVGPSQPRTPPSSIEDATPKSAILPPLGQHPNWRFSDFGGLLDELNGVEKVVGDVHKPPPAQPAAVENGLGRSSAEVRTFLLAKDGANQGRTSGAAEISKRGRSSGDTTDSNAEAWEKLEWNTESSNSGGSGLNKGVNAKRFKKKPPPLDLFNPYQKDRRLQGPPQPLNIPDTPKKMHSPLLSPFMGFTGRHWNGGPSTPPTPSLMSSAMGGAGSSSAGIGGGRGLFAKLFDWKSPNLYLISAESLSATKEECARTLRSLNIAFVPSDQGGFKCRADDILDLQGNHILKTVRFRIDLETIGIKHQATPQMMASTSSSSSGERSSSSEPPSQWDKHVANALAPRTTVDSGGAPAHSSTRPSQIPWALHSATPLCVVTFMQEKGAYSMLKVIHQRIQQSWMLDQSQTVEYNPSPAGYPLTPVSARPILGGHRSSPLLS